MVRNSLVLGALACSVSNENLGSEFNNQAYATQITADNAAQLIRGGPDAIGGIGDWFITNGTLCAIVSSIAHESEFSDRGGSLVDLGFCGRADDHFPFLHDLLQGSRRRPLDGSSIRVQQDLDSATVLVTSKRDGAIMVTEYTLSPELPTQLHIKKRLRQSKEGEPFNFFSAVNFNYHSLEPFVFASNDLTNTNGFHNEEFVSRGTLAMKVAARNADTIITPSPPTAQFGISYGWHLASAQRVTESERVDLPRFMLADNSSNAMLILTDTFYLGNGDQIGWLQIPQIPLLTLGDAAIETQETIYVGKRGDIASVTDQFFQDQPRVVGHVNETNVALHIVQQNGRPLTHVRPDSTGKFDFRLPPGTYKLQIMGTADRSLEKQIEVTDTGLDLGQLRMPPPATLQLPRGQAMRLVFVGINGTKTPDFADTLTGATVTGADGESRREPVSQIFLAGVAGDKTSIELAPGDYLVYATRGPEFTLEKTAITVAPGSTNRLNITVPMRAISTPKYIASDLHVHSGLSFDSTFSEIERVRTFVAEHAEVLVSSEHDVPVDFSPMIKQMGLTDQIVAIAAAEVTSTLPSKLNPYTAGHANVFPYPPERYAYRRGMLNHENRRWRDIIHDVKTHLPNAVIQLNHPRLNLELSGAELPDDWPEIIEYGQFLDHMGSAGHPYNPHQPLHQHPNSRLIEADSATGLRDIDFDLIELINPGGEHHDDRITAVRRDWMSFLKQGERLVATANSDSHGAHFQVGVPRTMVAMTNDNIKEFQQAEFLDSLKTGNVYGTTGPMLNIDLNGRQMGETFAGERGQLELNIFSTDWIPVTNVKIQINGETIDEHHLTDRSEHTLLIPLSFSQDSFVTVEVSGPITQEYHAVYPELRPYAFSNPIYVDFDSDGKWSAPGF